MRRTIQTILIMACAASTAVTSVRAAGLLRPVDAAYGDLELKDHKVKVVINNGFSRTEVDQVFHNPGAQDLEALYTFPVPDKAAMSELSLWIDGKEVVGEVLPKEEAKKGYQEEKSAGRAAAVNEKDDSKWFQVRVFPVRAGQDTRIRLVYYQPLEVDTGIGRYVYPLEEGGVDDARDAAFFLNDDAAAGEAAFTFDATIKTSYPLEAVLVPSHPDASVTRLGPGGYRVTYSSSGAAALRKDLVLDYRLASDRPVGMELLPYKARGTAEGTFMVVVTPGADLPPITHGVDWTFILDVSGSMADKLPTLVEDVEKALGHLPSEDRFRIVLFNDVARWLVEPFAPADHDSVRKAIEGVRALRASGGTNLYDGLRLGLGDLDADRTSAVLLASDGVANVGVTGHREFLELMRRADVRLFTFVMGNSANQPLLGDLAAVSNGFAINVSNGDSAIGRVLQAKSKLSHQAMRDVGLRVEGIHVFGLTPSRPLTLYRGDQLVIFGKYRGHGKGVLRFDAKVAGKPMTVGVPVEFPETDERDPEIERLWALSRIRELEQEKRLGGDAAALDATVRELATRYSLVTDQTSMVVMRDEQFARRGISRLNAARSAGERDAQARRVDPAPTTLARAPQPVHQWSAPRMGGGSVGPLFGLLSLLAALTSARPRGRGR